MRLITQDFAVVQCPVTGQQETGRVLDGDVFCAVCGATDHPVAVSIATHTISIDALGGSYRITGEWSSAPELPS